MIVLTRREFLAAAGGTVVRGMSQTAVRTSPPSLADSGRASARQAFDVPPGACDCHVHVFGDPARFPFADSRTYTPAMATVDELRAHQQRLGIDRVVIVQPSVYGTDNSCTLDAVRQLGSRARGVAVVDAKTPDAHLTEMKATGIRGIRVNLGTAGVTDPEIGRQRFRAAVARARALEWHVQVFTQLSVIQALRDDVLAAPVPIVFDHFGGARAALGVAQPGFDVLTDLVANGKAYVKISAAYRSSTRPPDYPDVAPLAKALIAANRNRILWGSDWPHPDASTVTGRKPTDIAAPLPIDDARVFQQLSVWVPEAAVRHRILVDNPARLYGF